jgi:hypothetical protein
MTKQQACETVPFEETANKKRKLHDGGEGPPPIPASLITVAEAKTGRSRCRLCMEHIEKGKIRVGMEAWIAGRKSMTWQHPRCFIRNIVVEEAANARAKCKITGQSFGTGDVKLGFCSHKSKLWVSLASAPKELAKVLVVVGAEVKLPELEGFSSLPEAKQLEVATMLTESKQGASTLAKSTQARDAGIAIAVSGVDTSA